MIRPPYRRGGIPAGALANTVWVSTFMAMIFSLPPLGIFLGIYHGTGSLAAGAAVGFGSHFATLAFAGRISGFLTRAMS